MAIKNLDNWMEKLEREMGIKSSIILSGNTSDIMLNQRNNGRYEPVIQSVISAARNKGFEKVIKWDRVDGIDYGVSDTVEMEEDSTSTSQSSEAYSFDDDEPTVVGGNTYKNPDDFFPYLLNVIRNRSNKVAIVIDYSDYIFGNANALSEKERDYLATLGKALVQSDNYNMLDTNFYDVSNIIIIITQSTAAIPPSYYLNNPEVSTINVPYPGRTERERFIDTNKGCLRINQQIDSNKVLKDDLIDSLEGFSLKEIAQIMKLSRQITNETFTSEKLINLFKYGEKISPWEELSRGKLATIEDKLKERVKGQDDAIAKVKDVIIRAYTGFSGLQHSSKQKKPKGTLFFVGPTGVGKTELAKSIAQFVFGDENACIRFDMSEFNHEHSDQRLVGAPPGYVGYEAGGQLTNAIKEKPFCVLLFDEIEKAHGKILDKFLQILEDGRLTDGKGETVYFSETIIIFTSNIGAAEVDHTMGKSGVRKQFIQKVQQHFVGTLGRPELLNRIGDNIVAFNFIDNEEVFIKIAQVKFKVIEDFVSERYNAKIRFDNRETAFRAIANKAGIENGGRGLLNAMESAVVNPLSNYVFDKLDMLAGRTIMINPMFPDKPEKAIFDFELE